MIARSIVGAIQTCWRDRKSTRLNSSHGYISYAVFCLKKKKNNQLRATHIHQLAPRTRPLPYHVPNHRPPTSLPCLTPARSSTPHHPPQPLPHTHCHPF